MLAALLAGYLIFSGGNGFAAQLFGKDNQALIRQVVADPARAEAALRTLKQGQTDLDQVGKRFEEIVKGFTKTDQDRAAGLDRLTPYLEQAAEQRRALQGKTLDRLFELRGNLTPEEWGALLAKLK